MNKIDQYVQKEVCIDDIHPAEIVACRIITRQNMSFTSIEDKDFAQLLKKSYPGFKGTSTIIL